MKNLFAIGITVNPTVLNQKDLNTLKHFDEVHVGTGSILSSHFIRYKENEMTKEEMNEIKKKIENIIEESNKNVERYLKQLGFEVE
jgi:arsenate reductase-like glutaredoxin family protein